MSWVVFFLNCISAFSLILKVHERISNMGWKVNLLLGIKKCQPTVPARNVILASGSSVEWSTPSLSASMNGQGNGTLWGKTAPCLVTFPVPLEGFSQEQRELGQGRGSCSLRGLCHGIPQLEKPRTAWICCLECTHPVRRALTIRRLHGTSMTPEVTQFPCGRGEKKSKLMWSKLKEGNPR